MKRKILIALLVVLCIIIFVSCDDNDIEELILTRSAYSSSFEVQKQESIRADTEESTVATTPGATKSNITAESDSLDARVTSNAEIEQSENIKNTTESIHSHVYYIATEVSPTCIDKGVNTYQCKCGAMYSEEVPAIGHKNIVISNSKEATCCENGYTGDVCCSVCGLVMEQGHDIHAIEHKNSYLVNYVEATDNKSGYSGDQYCPDCHTIVAKGKVTQSERHEHTVLLNKVDATCTRNGYTGDEYCSDCNNIVSMGQIIPALGHINTEIKNVIIATNKNDGYSGDEYCADCGLLIAKGNVIPKASDSDDNETEFDPR